MEDTLAKSEALAKEEASGVRTTGEVGERRERRLASSIGHISHIGHIGRISHIGRMCSEHRASTLQLLPLRRCPLLEQEEVNER